MSEDLRQFTQPSMVQSLAMSSAGANSPLLSQISHLSSTHDSPSLSSTASLSSLYFDNMQQNLRGCHEWIKMSECDDFIGPKRSKHTMVTYGNTLYVFGGDNGKQMLNDIVSYDCNNNSWGRALNGSPPTTRYHHTAVVYNNSMFVFGGYTGDLNSNSNLCNKNDLYEYRFGTGNWILWNTENAPAARAAHGAVVYDHKLWIFAGYDGNARLNDMWFIPLNSTTSSSAPRVWTEVEQTGDQPSTVCNSPLAVVQDSMYLFSGQSGAKTSNHLFKFDFKTLCWTKMVVLNFILRGTNTPPERRSGHIMVAHDNRLYIYGGVLGNSFFHDIYSFDLETKTWDLITMNLKSPIPSGRSFLSASVQNHHLYVFGGNGEENTRSNELYRFKLPNQPKSTLKEDFYKLLKKELFCDLRFLCSDKQVIPAHCAIVAARSSYCRQLIKLTREKMQLLATSSPTKLSRENSGGNASSLKHDGLSLKTISSSTSSIMSIEEAKSMRTPPFIINPGDFIEIKISGENSEALKLVLEFLYTDRIMSLEGRECEIETVKLMVDVYKIANLFLIPKLKRICEHFVDSSITCANVLNLLRYVDMLNLSILKDHCLRFLTKDVNFNQVIMMPEFEQLNQTLMVEIIRLKQTPRKYTNADQINEIIFDQSTSLEQDLANFLKRESGNELSDILILLDEATQPIYSHMCILAARCAYFEGYFRSFMPKDRKVLMAIGDTIPPLQACISLLRYIYYDDVNMPPQDALYLFAASHYFQFSNLRLNVFCKQNLEANVSKNNVFDILEAADKINDDYMKNFALKIVRNNFPELVNSNRIKKLSKDLLLDILVDISSLFTRSPNSSITASTMMTNQSNITLMPTLSVSILPTFSQHMQPPVSPSLLNHNPITSLNSEEHQK